MEIRRFINKIILKTIPLPFLENFKICLKNFEKHPPILIHQMGKVGSTTVYNSLLKLGLPNPIFHIHFISHQGIKDAEEYLKSVSKKEQHRHLIHSKILRKKMDTQKNVRWKIISLVREPILRDISDLFQVVDRYYPQLIDSNGNVDATEAANFLEKQFDNYDESTNYTCTWFDKEIKRPFNIDVYEYPFNHEKGFTTIHKGNIDLLIMRLEDLSRCFNNAISSFLNMHTPPLELLNSNIGKDKKYSVAYSYILQNISLPQNTCVKIYSSKYATYFYSEEMRNRFIQKWSNT